MTDTADSPQGTPEDAAGVSASELPSAATRKSCASWPSRNDPASQDPSAFLGQPTIVVAALDLSIPHTVARMFPSLGKMFVGTLLATEHRVADVFVPGPVAREQIVAVWQPGDAAYDSHPTLPRD